MRALKADIPLLCALGWHKPEPVARWNSGYYFTKCARCGQDLIRTAYGRWIVPRGYRVVWQAEQPANAPSAKLIRDRSTSPPESEIELPIQEVLRHLQNGGPYPVGRGAEAGPKQAERALADSPIARQDELLLKASPSSRIPDFMDEATGVSAWESPSRAYLRRPRPPAQEPGGEYLPANADQPPGRFSRLKTQVVDALDRRRRAPEAALQARRPGMGASPNMRHVVVAALSVGLVLLALILWIGPEDGRSAQAHQSSPEGARSGPGVGRTAFVTATLLNCRSAPVPAAEPVKILARGDQVRLLAREGGWVGLAHEDTQCWAPAQFFSLAAPI